MKPLPKAAMPVVKVLRRDVPRPKTLPFVTYPVATHSCPRWDRRVAFCNVYIKEKVCPMGLCSTSKSGTPYVGATFADGVCSDTSVKSFYHWWDALREKDLPKAMDAIWPKKRVKK
jgi:hypothetical protein